MSTRIDVESIVRDLAAPPRRWGSIAMVVAAGTLVVVGWVSLPLVALAVVSPGALPESVATEKLIKKQAEFGDLLAKSTDAVVAREPFGRVRTGARTTGPITPGVPLRYGGPAIVGMIGDAIWFADGTRATAGHAASGSSAVEVLEVNAPWSAKVRWMRGEFTVSLFERDATKWAQPMSVWSGPPPIAVAPPVEAPKPAAPPAPVAAAAAGTPPPAGPPGGLPTVGANGQIILPGGATFTPPVGGQVIIREGESVIAIPAGGVPMPPPPPPDEPEKH